MANNTDDANTPNGQIDRDPGDGWFAYNKFAYSLDVVTLLAVIGEQSMSEHFQTINTSLTGCFPRILPAPQAFLLPSRPTKLPHVTARVMGTTSGIDIPSLSMFVESLIGQRLHQLKPYSFMAVTIKHRADIRELQTIQGDDPSDESGSDTRRSSRTLTDNGLGARINADTPNIVNNNNGVNTNAAVDNDVGSSVPAAHPAFNPGDRPPTQDSSNIDLESQQQPETPGLPEDPDRPNPNGTGSQSIGANSLAEERSKKVNLSAHFLRPRWDSPLVLLAWVSFFITMGDLGLALRLKDGMGVVAILVVGMASICIGIAGKWKPRLTTVHYSKKHPPGDVILVTRGGAYVYVKCEEPLTRELFTGSHSCVYWVDSLTGYKIFMAIATAFIMVSVIFLGNCLWQVKAAIGASYICLNFAYWVCSMVDRQRFWDLSRYEVYHWDKHDFTDSENTIPAPILYYPKGYLRKLWQAFGYLWFPKRESKPRTLAEVEILNGLNEKKREILVQRRERHQTILREIRARLEDDPNNANLEFEDETIERQQQDLNTLAAQIALIEREPSKRPNFRSRLRLFRAALFNRTGSPNFVYLNDKNKRFEKECSTRKFLCKLRYWENMTAYPRLQDMSVRKMPHYKSEQLGFCHIENQMRRKMFEDAAGDVRVPSQRVKRWYQRFTRFTREPSQSDESPRPQPAPRDDELDTCTVDEDTCFTQAVWCGIRATRTTKWARMVLPEVESWKIWMRMAEEHLAMGDYYWKSVSAKNAVHEWARLTKWRTDTDKSKIQDYIDRKFGFDVDEQERKDLIAQQMWERDHPAENATDAQ